MTKIYKNILKFIKKHKNKINQCEKSALNIRAKIRLSSLSTEPITFFRKTKLSKIAY